MASVTRDPAASMDGSTGMFCGQISGLIAGAAIAACDACYVKAADGKVYPSNGTAATEPAKFDGFAVRTANAGDAITLYGVGARMRYSASLLIPGQDLFLDVTNGLLADAATTGGTTAIARAINATDIRCTRNSA